MIIIAIVVCIVLLAVSRLVLPFCSLKRRGNVCIRIIRFWPNIPKNCDGVYDMCVIF